MDKKVIKKILQNGSLTQEELNTFIVKYVESFDRTVSPEQLQGIIVAIQHRMFNLQYAAEQAGIKLGMLITKTIDKNGQILKIDIRDE